MNKNIYVYIYIMSSISIKYFIRSYSISITRSLLVHIVAQKRHRLQVMTDVCRSHITHALIIGGENDYNFLLLMLFNKWRPNWNGCRLTDDNLIIIWWQYTKRPWWIKPESVLFIHIEIPRWIIATRLVYSYSGGLKPCHDAELTTRNVPGPIDAESSRPFKSDSFIE